MPKAVKIVVMYIRHLHVVPLVPCVPLRYLKTCLDLINVKYLDPNTGNCDTALSLVLE